MLGLLLVYAGIALAAIVTGAASYLRDRRHATDAQRLAAEIHDVMTGPRS